MKGLFVSEFALNSHLWQVPVRSLKCSFYAVFHNERVDAIVNRSHYNLIKNYPPRLAVLSRLQVFDSKKTRSVGFLNCISSVIVIQAFDYQEYSYSMRPLNRI